MEEELRAEFQREVAKWKEKLLKATTKEEMDEAEEELRGINRKYWFFILTPEGRKEMEEIGKALLESTKKMVDLAKEIMKEE